MVNSRRTCHELSGPPRNTIRRQSMVMAAKIGDANRFRSGRDFVAIIGLTPKDHTTAGRKKLGGITRAGNEMLRTYLICGATAVIRQLKHGRGHNSPWLKELVARKPERA